MGRVRRVLSQKLKGPRRILGFKTKGFRHCYRPYPAILKMGDESAQVNAELAGEIR